MKSDKSINEIIRKYLACKSTRVELEDALELFSDPYQHLELHPALFEFWNEDSFLPDVEFQEKTASLVLDKIHHRINMEKGDKSSVSLRKIVFQISKIAAILVVGFLIGISIQKIQKTEPEYYTSIAPKGSISQLILPDNTIVFLNAGSKIEFSNNRNSRNREVFLEGEAWFDVTKNKKKPFIVHTPIYDVNVTGTKFDVKAYKTDKEITTTLEEGQIIIHSKNNFRLQEDVVLKPGEQFVLNKDSRTTAIKLVHTNWFTSWKDNKLIFVNMELKDLVVLLERKFGVDIRIKNKDILNLHFDGTIKNESILEILEYIKKNLPINYKIVGQKIEITNIKNN